MDYNKLYQSASSPLKKRCANQSGDRDLSNRQLLCPSKSVGGFGGIRPQLADVEICQALSCRPGRLCRAEMEGHLRVNTMFISAQCPQSGPGRSRRFHPGAAFGIPATIQEQGPAAGCRPGPCLPARRAWLLLPGHRSRPDQIPGRSQPKSSSPKSTSKCRAPWAIRSSTSAG